MTLVKGLSRLGLAVAVLFAFVLIASTFASTTYAATDDGVAVFQEGQVLLAVLVSDPVHIPRFATIEVTQDAANDAFAMDTSTLLVSMIFAALLMVLAASVFTWDQNNHDRQGGVWHSRRLVPGHRCRDACVATRIR